MKAIRGFSILEVLLALSITLVVMAMVAQTLSHVAAIYDAQTDLATTGSTVAVALDDIVFEISLAGQGLGEGIPAVLPTLPGTRASASAITLRSNPDVTATFLLEALGENGEPTPADGASLFDKDDLVVVTDARGRVERAIVARAGEAALGLRSIDSADGELRGNYTPQSGARVLALREVHYFLDEAKGGELVKNVEGVSRRVLARGVTGLSFEYLGREGETIALAKAETSGELATVRVTITYEAGEEGLPARSLATAVTPAPRSGTVDFEQHDARFRLSRTFYPLDRPTGVASRIGADWAVVLCSGVNPTSDPASLFSFQVEKRFLGAGVDNVTYLDDVRAPVTLAFAPETGRLSGSLFIAAWGLRIGHLSRIAPDAYGKLSAESEMTTFEGTDAIAQSGGMAFGVDRRSM